MKFKNSPRYTEAFIREAVQASLSSPQTQASLAARLGVHPNTLSRWRKEWVMDNSSRGKALSDPGPEKSVQDLEREVKRMKKQLKRAQLENDILKKRTSTSSDTASEICLHRGPPRSAVASSDRM